jgi:hypothetical protein
LKNNLPVLMGSVLFGIVFASAALMVIGREASARPTMGVLTEVPGGESANEALRNTLNRLTFHGEPVYEEIKKATDLVRTSQYDGKLRLGIDYLNAARILTYGKSTEDALLAHDMALCALALGERTATRCIALSQDQYLSRSGGTQRYGTISKNGKLMPIQDGVSDSMRFILGVPSLMQAKRNVGQRSAGISSGSLTTSVNPNW